MDEIKSDRILLITTTSCSYPGADSVGQAHLEYSPNTYIIEVPDPALLPEDFFLRAFSKGIAGIIIMSSGSDCPYAGAYEKIAQRVQHIYDKMKKANISISRLKLTTICSVCKAAFLKEIKNMEENISKLKTVKNGN